MKLINSKITTLILSTAAILALSGCGTDGVPSERGLSGSPAVADVNNPPVANAGADQTLFFGEDVTLDGSSSADADGDTLTYAWTLTAPTGSSATLSDATTVNPTFTTDVPGSYALQLTVNDGTVNSTADSMRVTAEDYTYNVTSSGVTYNDFGDQNGSIIMDMELSTDSTTLYTALNVDGLSIVNLSTGVSEHVTTGMYGRYVKLSNDGTIAYLSAGGDYEFSFIDLASKSITNSISTNDYTIGIAVTSDNSKLYLGTEGTGITTIDVATETISDIAYLHDEYANTVILSADETKLYISESGIGFVTYDIVNDTNTTIETISNYANDFDITSDETTAYVTTGGNDAGVDIVSLTDKNVTATIYDINATDTLSYTMQAKITDDDKLLFIADRNYNNTLFVVDIENNHAVTSVISTSGTLCEAPRAVEISPDGLKVFIGCSNGVVAVFDMAKVAK